MNARQHENDSLYGWSPADTSDLNPADPFAKEVPSDLVQFYREFKYQHWGYVCPCCKNVFAPGFGGMPETFRAHIRPWYESKGCFFNPRAEAGSGRK